MSPTQELEDAVTRSKSLPQQSNEVLLELYSHYKQATLGDVSGEEPSLFDMVGRTKYQAWKDRQGMSQEEATNAYVALVNRLAGG